VGEYFLGKLRTLQQRLPVIGEVRGKGLMIGVELVSDPATRTPATALCQAVITKAFERGLLLLPCGASTVRFMPPLMVNEGHVDEALALLEAAMLDALA
jgi:4-aminobutyrate aminotransferase